ncbi:MAG TPA: A24 family peptidase [Pusillimonas sp.]
MPFTLSSSFAALAWPAVMAILGAGLGVQCSRVALAYGRRLDAGAPPDAASMMHALRAAIHPCAIAAVAHGMVVAADNPVRAQARATWFGRRAACTMATGFVALHAQYGLDAYFFAAALAGLLLLLLALIDAQTGLLPDALTQPLLWLGLASSWAGAGPPLHDALAGAILGYGFLWCLLLIMRSLIGRDAMGHGDLKLLAALGAWLGWQALPWVLLLACFLGLVFAMWRQKSFRPRGEHPFGPFLAGCAAGVFLAPTAVHSWFC